MENAYAGPGVLADAPEVVVDRQQDKVAGELPGNRHRATGRYGENERDGVRPEGSRVTNDECADDLPPVPRSRSAISVLFVQVPD